MKIAVLDDYQDAVRQLDAFRLLDGHDVTVFTHSAKGVGQLAARLAPFDALVLVRERTAVTRALLDKLPNLKLVAQTGPVGAHIDVDACTARGVAVVQGAGSPVAPAELTWALIMASQRRVVQYANHLKDGLWQAASADPEFNGLGTACRGRTLGIWGYGKVGTLVAGYGRAFGMRVLVWGSEATRLRAAADGHEAAPSRAALFSESDVLTLHLRQGDATRSVVTSGDLARMKPSSLFVNTSRAALVEAGALEAALAAGRPGRAALDVFDAEPLASSSPLLRMPTVLATPHIGYVERDSYETYFGDTFASVAAFAAGAPRNLVNPAYRGSR